VQHRRVLLQLYAIITPASLLGRTQSRRSQPLVVQPLRC